MAVYLYGIGLLIIGIALVIVNCILFFLEYKSYITSNIKINKFYYGLNFISILLALICIIEGIVYLFVVHSQLS